MAAVHQVGVQDELYPSAEGRLALRGEDLDRYRKSGSMVVLTLPPTFIHSEVRSGGLICPGGRV